MQHKPTLSIQKLIFAVVFVSAALITSLFVFHLKQKPLKTHTANNNAMIFPAARDIKPFDLVTSYKAKFTQNQFRHHWTLLFFGFTHCSSICPVTLDLLNQAYTTLHPAYPMLQVVFISLDPERDQPQALSEYTRSFNPDFIGVSGNIQEIRKLQSQLGVYAARDAEATINDNYQIQHTASVLLINPTGQWAGLFKSGLNPKQFTEAFEESISTFATTRSYL